LEQPATPGKMDLSTIQEKNGIAVARGYQSKVLLSTKSGYMVLSDWREDTDKNPYLHKAFIVKVGDSLNGEIIKTNTWYWFEQGKLKSKVRK